MTDPLLISFDVDCSADHAFNVWTSKIGTWWPRDHTVSGDPDEIVLESGAGGRIYERTATGERHEWGEVTSLGTAPSPVLPLAHRPRPCDGDRGRDHLHRRECGTRTRDRDRAQRVGGVGR